MRINKEVFRNKKMVGIGIALIFALLIGGIYAFANEIFVPKQIQIANAFENTLSKKSNLTKTLAVPKLNSENCTVTLNAGLGNIHFSTDNMINKKERIAISDNELTAGESVAEFRAEVNDTKAILYCPPILKKDVLVYDSSKNNCGEIDNILASFGTSTTGVNHLMTELFESSSEHQLQKDLKQIFIDEFKELKFKTDGHKELILDGKKCRAKNLKVTLSEKDISRLTKKIEEVYQKDCPDMYRSLKDRDNVFDRVKETAKNKMSVDFTISLAGKYGDRRIAEIDLIGVKTGDGVKLQLNGGNYSFENCKLTSISNGETVKYVKKGYIKNNIEYSTITTSSNKNLAVSTSYNFANDEYSIKLKNAGEIKGKLKTTKDTLLFTIDKTILNKQDIDLTGSFSYKNGTHIVPFHYSGKERDLGQINKKEYEELRRTTSNDLYSFFQRNIEFAQMLTLMAN